MENNKKLDINNLYVGELYLSHELGSFISGHCLSKEEIEERNKIVNVANNGAIRINRRGDFTDFENRRSYECALTLFYKDGEQFISLHDGKSYNNEGTDFCTGLVPLTELLPKIDFNAPKYLNENEAKRYFDILFKSNLFSKIEKLYNPTKHSISEFYAGPLCLYEGYSPARNITNRYHFSNLPQQYMLYRSGARIGGMYGYSINSKDEFGLMPENHHASDFECLFMKVNNGLYNIHNNQIYTNGTLKNELLDDIPLGESYYERMIPFEEYLDYRKIKHFSKDITIPQSIKLYMKRK